MPLLKVDVITKLKTSASVYQIKREDPGNEPSQRNIETKGSVNNYQSTAFAKRAPPPSNQTGVPSNVLWR